MLRLAKAHICFQDLELFLEGIALFFRRSEVSSTYHLLSFICFLSLSLIYRVFAVIVFCHIKAALQGRAKTVHFTLVRQLLYGMMHEEKPISDRRKAYGREGMERKRWPEKNGLPFEGSDWQGVIKFFILSCQNGRISPLGVGQGRRAVPGDGNGTQNIGLHNNTNRVIIVLSNLFTRIKLSNYNN